MMKQKKYYTLDDLYDFCQKNNFSHFSAKEFGGPIIVQSLGEFETQNTYDADYNQGLVPVTLQACHTKLNRNKSFISDETMTKALPSFANKPILGYIHQLDDGTYDFYTHNISYLEDEDGFRIEYDERPIGVVPESCNAHLEYDEENDKNYVVVTGYIYEDYGNRAVEIIKNNGGKTKVSVEIAVNEMSYNAKEGYLNIDDMYFMGVTCLGKTPDGEVVQEGMEGANLKLDNFSIHENSMFSDKIVDLLSVINSKLDSISNIQFNEKGVETEMSHFEELLEKYNKTAEEIDFDYENMTNEELDAKFAELFDDEESPAEVEEKFVKNFSIELSHGDIYYALYNLIEQYDSEDNDWYYIRDVYDDYFYMQSWHNNKLYKLSYSVDGENVSLDGERQEMFEIIVSESERISIEKMRDNYSALEEKYNELKEFKDSYDAEQIKSEKTAVLESVEYSDIKESDGFKQLISDMDNYSVEEIKVKADLLFAEYAKTKLSFEAEESEKKHSVGINLNAKPSKKRAYARLFDE